MGELGQTCFWRTKVPDDGASKKPFTGFCCFEMYLPLQNKHCQQRIQSQTLDRCESWPDTLCAGALGRTGDDSVHSRNEKKTPKSQAWEFKLRKYGKKKKSDTLSTKCRLCKWCRATMEPHTRTASAKGCQDLSEGQQKSVTSIKVGKLEAKTKSLDSTSEEPRCYDRWPRCLFFS